MDLPHLRSELKQALEDWIESIPFGETAHWDRSVFEEQAPVVVSTVRDVLEASNLTDVHIEALVTPFSEIQVRARATRPHFLLF